MPDWDEEMSKQYISKGVKVTALTAKALAVGALLLLKMLFTREKSGEQSLSQIKRGGGKLISTTLKGTDLEALDRIAKRYKVGFAAMENPDGKSYTLFFKAQSEHQMTAALKAYLAQTVQKGEKPKEKKEPLDDQLSRAKQKSQEHAAEHPKQRVREKEHSR